MDVVRKKEDVKTEDIVNLKGISDFGHYLDKRIIDIFRTKDFDWDKEIEIFKKTFQMIDECMGDSAFLKYDVEKEKFTGRFYTSAFEFVAIGLGRKEGVLPLNFNLKEQVIELWKDIAEQNVSWKGFNAAGRLAQTLKLVDKLYSDE